MLKYLRVKRVEKVLLFFCKIYSRRFYTLYFDELKFFLQHYPKKPCLSSTNHCHNLELAVFLQDCFVEFAP